MFICELVRDAQFFSYSLRSQEKLACKQNYKKKN